MNLVRAPAGRAGAHDAIVAGVHRLDVIAGARELAGVEMSLVGELGRERFLREALETVLGGYDHVVVDTPPNLGLLTVNALVCAERVLAPVSVEDEASLHGIFERRQTIAKLAERPSTTPPDVASVLTRLAATPHQQPRHPSAVAARLPVGRDAGHSRASRCHRIHAGVQGRNQACGRQRRRTVRPVWSRAFGEIRADECS